jgi:hypothetical protein
MGTTPLYWSSDKETVPELPGPLPATTAVRVTVWPVQTLVSGPAVTTCCARKAKLSTVKSATMAKFEILEYILFNR